MKRKETRLYKTDQDYVDVYKGKNYYEAEFKDAIHLFRSEEEALDDVKAKGYKYLKDDYNPLDDEDLYPHEKNIFFLDKDDKIHTVTSHLSKPDNFRYFDAQKNSLEMLNLKQFLDRVFLYKLRRRGVK